MTYLDLAAGLLMMTFGGLILVCQVEKQGFKSPISKAVSQVIFGGIFLIGMGIYVILSSSR